MSLERLITPNEDPAVIMAAIEAEVCSNTVYIVIIVIMGLIILALIGALIGVAVTSGGESGTSSEETTETEETIMPEENVITTEEKVITTAEGEEIPATGGLMAGPIPKAGQAKGPWLKVRKIRFEPPKNGTYFHVAELEIYSNGINIAKKGIPVRTGGFLNGDAINATDGKLTPHSISMNVKDGFFFEIDLKSEMPIDGIVYYADGSGARAVSTQVFLIDNDGNQATAGILNSNDRQVLEP